MKQPTKPHRQTAQKAAHKARLDRDIAVLDAILDLERREQANRRPATIADSIARAVSLLAP